MNLMQQISHSKGVSGQASASNHKKGKFGKGSQQQNKTNKSHNARGPKPDIKKPNTCWFCKKEGHKKKDCYQYKAWLERKNKKGNNITFVCLDASLVVVPPNSWWLDSGSPINIANSLQGFITKRQPSEGEINLHVGNGVKVDVLFIGTIALHFRSGFRIILENTAFVPSMRRSLVSLSKLDESGYHFHFGNKKVEVSLNSSIVGECLLCDGLYQLDLNSDAIAFHVDNAGTKRLGHISQERIGRLIKSQILPQLVYDNIESCVDCIKGKLTKTRKQQGVARSNDLLELIHTDISGPYSHSLCGKSFFVTFMMTFLDMHMCI